MRHLITALLCLPACLDAAPATTCEEEVCAYAPACGELTTGEWDWRSEQACLDTFACGQDPDACLEAVMALPCLSSPPTEEEVLAHTRSMKLVKDACMGGP